MLLVVALLYFFGAVAAFIAAGRHVEPQLRTKLLAHGFQHTFLAIVLMLAFILALRRSKAADLSSGLAAAVTAYFAIKALATGLVAGFRVYHLFEPLVILPAMSFVFWTLARPSHSRKGKGEDHDIRAKSDCA